jgi:hypothetical protein
MIKSPQTEIKRFPGFARQIMAVSKTEIDRSAEAYKKHLEMIQKSET